ncbi:hypothetical protein [Actinoplanes lutulentus]|uniref:hypothetical protein n=1 Tax=Actinoplanes lutulentus TaxID=1287878 RepID=UPI001C656143|nr:hypothetical protein [Actinoplanes lutulentus]
MMRIRNFSSKSAMSLAMLVAEVAIDAYNSNNSFWSRGPVVACRDRRRSNGGPDGSLYHA